jgi:hypothetical protein
MNRKMSHNTNDTDDYAIGNSDSPDVCLLGHFEYMDTLGRRFRRPPPGIGGKGTLLHSSSENVSGIARGLAQASCRGDMKHREALRVTIRAENCARGHVVAKTIQPLPKVQIFGQTETSNVPPPHTKGPHVSRRLKCTTPQLCSQRQRAEKPCMCDKYYVPYLPKNSDMFFSWQELVEGFGISSF